MATDKPVSAVMLQDWGADAVSKDGGESMKAFMRHQMMSILQPFGESAKEMQAQIHHHSEDFERNRQHISDIMKELNTTNCDVNGVRDDARNNGSRLSTLKDSMDRGHRSTATLEDELARANSKLGRVDNELQSAMEVIQELRRELTETTAEARQNTANADATRRDVTQIVQGNLGKTQASLQGLDSRFAEAVQEINELKRRLERTDTSVHKAHTWMEGHDKDKAHFNEHFISVSKNIDQMSGQVEDNFRRLQACSRSLQAAEADQRLTRVGLENLDSTIHGIQMSHNAAEHSLADLKGSYTKTFDEVSILKAHKLMADQFHADSMEAICKNEKRSDNLYEQMKLTIGELRKTEQYLESLFSKTNMMNENLDKTATRVVDLTRSHRKAASCIQTLNHELDKTNTHARSTHEALEETTVATHHLKADFGQSSTTISRMGRSLEEAHANFGGIRAGFQDVHTVSDSMVPSKTATVRCARSFGLGSDPRMPTDFGELRQQIGSRGTVLPALEVGPGRTPGYKKVSPPIDGFNTAR